MVAYIFIYHNWNKKNQIVKAMYENNIAIDMISKVTCLTKEEVEEIIKGIK